MVLHKIHSYLNTTKQFLYTALVFFLCLQQSIAYTPYASSPLEQATKTTEEISEEKDAEENKIGEQSQVGKFRKAKKQLSPPPAGLENGSVENSNSFGFYACMVPLKISFVSCFVYPFLSLPRYLAFHALVI